MAQKQSARKSGGQTPSRKDADDKSQTSFKMQMEETERVSSAQPKEKNEQDEI